MTDFAQTVKQQADIVKIIEGYLRLRKAGATNYSGLCPFHKEKSPSFSVHAVRQFYHCFGCGVSGDVFSFVGKIENVSFPEAVRIVAQRSGIPLPKREFSSPEEAAEARLRRKLLDLHEAAAAWFEEQLRGPEGAVARQYLASRGMTPEGIKTFRIGYAPDSFNALRDRLSSMADAETLRASGLVSAKETGTGEDGRPQYGPLYDRFRKRVMFPIGNESGKVIAFTARTLESGEKAGPKYINSPETPLYSKGQVLFNLDKARTVIRQAGFALIVEGQMDCISLFLRGIQNVIATSGTAFTEQQVGLLKRHTSNVVVNFDPDTAGANAAEKSIALLTEEGFAIKIVTLEGGLDPDRFIRERGVEAYMNAVRGARQQSDYLIERARQLFPGASAEKKVKAMNFLLPHIRRMPERLVRDQFAHDAAQKLGINSAVLREEMRQAALKRRDHVEVRGQGLSDADRVLVRAALSGDESAHELKALIAESMAEHPEWFESLACYSALRAMLPAPDPFAALESQKDKELVARITMEADRVPNYTAEDMRSAGSIVTQRKLEGDDRLSFAEQRVPTREAVSRQIRALHHAALQRRHQLLIDEIAQAERSGHFARAVELGQQKLEVNRRMLALDRGDAANGAAR